MALQSEPLRLKGLKPSHINEMNVRIEIGHMIICSAGNGESRSRRSGSSCQHDIMLALGRVEHGAAAARSFQVARSKAGKAGVRRYCAALRRVRTAYQSLDPAIRPWFSLAEIAYVAGQPTVIDREIAKAAAFLSQPSPPPRREASRNKAAVAAAYDLLRWWDHKVAATRGGKWERLAKILVADRTVDLFDHLRAFKRSPSPSVEKLRGARSILYRTRRR